MATSINTRISTELEEKLKVLQEKISRDLPKGAEVTMSSLVRGAIEKLIEDHEDEENFVVTIKVPLMEASKKELECLSELKVYERFRALKNGDKEGVYSDSKSKKEERMIKCVLERFNDEVSEINE